MDAIEGLTPVVLTPGHLKDACALVREARWNQLEDDWRLFLRAGDAVGYEDPDGRVVASAASIPYGLEFGWISMVLVTRSWRRRGLATSLLKACMMQLECSGRVPVLDATPDGEKVYIGLGFSGTKAITRYERGARVASSLRDLTPGIRRLAAEDISALIECDSAIFGGDRGPLLKDLATRPGACGWISDDGSYLLSRKGSRARQIGPLVARDARTAATLIETAIATCAEPLFIDVPDQHEAIRGLLLDRAFVAQRPFLRMLKGRDTPFGDFTRIFAITGPEFG